MNSCKFFEEHLLLAIHGVHRRITEESVGESGRVGHQLAHGRRVLGIDKNHLAVGIHALEDLQMRELRNVFGDGVRRHPLALLVEQHHGHAGDRLGHGVVAEDDVLGHGRTAGHVALTVGAVVHHFSVARQDGDDACDLLLVNGLLHQGVQTFQPLRGEALHFGLYDRHVNGAADGLLRRRRVDAESQ